MVMDWQVMMMIMTVMMMIVIMIMMMTSGHRCSQAARRAQGCGAKGCDNDNHVDHHA